MKEQSIEQFLTDLSAKKSTPGAGGAAALVAAIGSALGSMVGNFTIGKRSMNLFNLKFRNVYMNWKR